jgi:hypothetical protein
MKRTFESRLQKLEQIAHKPIALLWHDQQNESELRAQIAEQKARGVHVVNWKHKQIDGET